MAGTDKPKKALSYDSSNIDIRGGLAGVRTNASMYLGSVDASGVFLAVRELLDNALDEHLAGRNTAVWLHIDSDGSYWVVDKGQGIPQGTKSIEMHVNGKDIVNKLPTMQAVFGELHTSGKYRTDAYKTSVGTHGIGSKGTNATAEFFDVVTCFKGKWYSIGFKKGKLTSPVKQLSKTPKGPDGKPLAGGTCIHFKPDAAIFSAKSFPPSMVVEWAEIMAYLNPGFAIIVSSKKGKKVFLSKKGATEYVAKRIETLKVEQLDAKLFEYKSDLADVVVTFTNYDGSDVRGFTNGLNNPEGGTHVASVQSALFKGLQAQAKGKKAKSFSLADFKEGLVGLINAKLHKAAFAGQNKAKLKDDRLASAFEKDLVVATTAFFAKHKALANKLIDRACQLNALKTSFTKSKKLVSNLNTLKRKGMPAKYASADPAVKAKDRELFLVEGDSAGGSVKKARLRNQCVLPLKGKVMNAIKAKGDKALESEEITHILGAIGFDPKASDPYAKLLVGKIILFADPDPDGHHINALLLALFYKYLPKLFELGMIYVAVTPEFYALHKGVVYYGNTLSEVQKKIANAKLPSNTAINHIKGWGEISPQLLALLALNPATRSLIRIEPISDDDSSFNLLMNDDAEYRKKLLGIAA